MSNQILFDDCQRALAEVHRLVGQAIDAGIKAQAGADPVSELVTRRLLDELQAAHGTAMQLLRAREVAHNQQSEIRNPQS